MLLYIGVQCILIYMCYISPPDAQQQNRERVIQSLEGAQQGGQGSEGRGLSLGLHQLPVRPVTQNGKHTAVATATSVANPYGTATLATSVIVFVDMVDMLISLMYGKLCFIMVLY